MNGISSRGITTKRDVLLVGSVTQENVPWKLGAIHAGDWIAKLVIISIVVTLWR